MKKVFCLFILTIFCTTVPVISNETLPVENSEYSNPENFPNKAPLYDRPIDIDKKEAFFGKHKKAIAMVVGTLATITIGLLVSGKNTGKHIPPRKKRENSVTAQKSFSTQS